MEKRPIFLKPSFGTGLLEAGCDEAGRGPLAGPVFAAAVILPPDFHHPLLNDSKQMSRRDRDTLRHIIEKEAVCWAVEEVSAEEIDALNILWASVTGMQKAALRLRPEPEFLLVDGNRFRPFGKFTAMSVDCVRPGASVGFSATESLPESTVQSGASDSDAFRWKYLTVVHGDATYASIAAASVLAKTWRDEKMTQLSRLYPGYGWEKNMGYPTAEHIEAIRRLGLTPEHRRSFHPKELEPSLF